ncbi:MAG: AMP-binding protein [Bacteroidota bacterium]|nr:AMP-binding protein [Bacteroidota bacterium]
MKQEGSIILIHRFLVAAEKYSDNPALEINGEVWSYSALLRLSAGIAHRIKSVSDESSPVAILADKSITAYAGILGALMASRPYMPLNPRFPLNRNLKMIQRAATDTIIVADDQLDMADEIKQHHPGPLNMINPGPGDSVNIEPAELVPDIHSTAEQTAYLLFTSGTTGEPKGVPVSNRNVTAYMDNLKGMYDFHESDRFSQTFDLTFDLSVHDLFVCWLSGGCLCVPAADKPLAYPKYINEHKITVWFSVPSMAVMMDKMRLLRPAFFPSLKWSFFCGEPLLEKTAHHWQQAAPSSRLINLYGPTETTIAIAAYEWQQYSDKNKSGNGIVSIGKIFKDQQYRILDDEKQTLEAKSQGLLHLSGTQVIDGYLQAREDESMSFVKLDPKSDISWYNTGDLVLEDADHDLFFLGRADAEVKISGYRVNMLEIDETIRRLAKINNLATIAVQDQSTGTQSLVSFVENDEEEFNEQHLLEICRKQLPWYMVPQKIIRIAHLPLNDNGKIDRNKLIELL